MLYSRFIRFIFPLFITLVVFGLEGPILNGGMARLPDAAQTLAGFGIAWGLTSLVISPFGQLNQLALVLSNNRQSKKRILNFVLICSGLMGLVLFLLALTPVGFYFIEKLHRLDSDLTAIIRHVFLWFIPYPLLEGLIRFYSGLLFRVHRTEITTVATVMGICSSVLAVLVLLQTELIQSYPIRLPIIVIYVGLVTHLGVVYWGYLRFSRNLLDVETEKVLSYRYILHFFWPLALTMAVQGISRPIVNLVISRGADGVEAMAILTVVYSLGHLPYGWLNELRSLAPAFKAETNSLQQIKKFIGACGLFSFSVMILAYWTPVRETILVEFMGLSGAIAEGCKMPLMIFTFFPIVVAIRAHFHGIALLKHQTSSLAASGPARVIAIILALVLLPLTGLPGATIGVTALLCGFVFETTTAAIGIRKIKYI